MDMTLLEAGACRFDVLFSRLVQKTNLKVHRMSYNQT
jgi:hypothetical protein